MQFNITFKTIFEYVLKKIVLCIQIRFVSTEKTTRIASRASCYCFIGNFMYLFIDVFLNKLNFIVIVISWSLFAQSFKINNILFQRTQPRFTDCMIHDTFKFMSSNQLCYKFQSSN